jgi:hypothetical protein
MTIIGLFIKDRIKESGKLQLVLSKHGCIIANRIGLHEVSEEKCSRNGIILLQLAGNEADCFNFENDLKEIGGIEIRKMEFVK